MNTIYKIFFIIFSAIYISQTSIAADFPPNPASKLNYHLDWQQEFNGSKLDKNVWLDYYLPSWTPNLWTSKADYIVGNGVLKLKVERSAKPWSIYDGKLRVSSIQTYNRLGFHRFNANAKVSSHGSSIDDFNGKTFKYGYFEMRAKLNNTGGSAHQAWWLVGDHSDDVDKDGRHTMRSSEIDILENFFEKGKTWQKVQHPIEDPMISYTNHIAPSPGNIDVQNEFHIYAMEWSPSGLKFYFDNKLVRSWQGGGYSPRYPMGMVLGVYSGEYNRVWPKQWQIDYVRVFQPNGGYPAPPVSYRYFRIKNRMTGEYIHAESNTNSVELSTRTATNRSWWSMQWEAIPVSGTEYYFIRNRQTGKELNLQDSNNRVVQNNALPDSYWSSHWLIFPAGKKSGVAYARLINRQHDEVIRAVSGYAQHPSSSTISIDHWPAQWEFEYVERNEY